MLRVLLTIFALLTCVRTFAADWTVVRHDGRDYIPFDNVSQFYGLGPVQKSGNAFSIAIGTRSLRGQSGSVEFYINNLKFNLSYPVVDQDGKLCVSRMDLVKIIEPVLRPGKISNAEQIDTVVLDPGHGGHDNGAMSPFGNEKAFTLDVAFRARMLFLQMGYKVYMTRTGDEFIPLEDRVRFANRFPNALFISIHFNSGGAGTGLETYTLAPRGVPSMMADGPRVSDLQECPGNVCDAENMALATATHASLVVRLHAFDHGMYDRGIKRARFVVIRDIMIPGVLVEGGFLSNMYDAKLVANPDYRQAMATSILQAVQTYRRAVGPTALQLARTNPALRPDAEAAAPPADPPPVAEPPATNPAVAN
jgi:N-acetylmuramoyl-L-alanine amidase